MSQVFDAIKFAPVQSFQQDINVPMTVLKIAVNDVSDPGVHLDDDIFAGSSQCSSRLLHHTALGHAPRRSVMSWQLRLIQGLHHFYRVF